MKRRNFTIAEIRSKHSIKKKERDRVDPWLSFVRPISFYPTWLFLRLGISANETTVIFIINGIIGCVFLAFGSYWAIIVGAILLNISFLLDVMDGNIARCNNSVTTYGAYIDRIGDAIMISLPSIGIGIGLYRHPDPYLNYLSDYFFKVGISNNSYIFLGMTYFIFSIFRLFVAATVPQELSIKPRDLYESKTGEKRGAWRIIYTLGFCLQGAGKYMIILVAAIVNILSVFIAIWTLITLCELIIVIIGILRLMKTAEG